MIKDSIGNRMKENYEDRYRIKLTRRVPVIIRLDGKAFHTLTRKCEKPFDLYFQKCMEYAAEGLCEKIQGAKCAYVQSDEISILLTDFDTLTTEAWFDYNLQKMVSVSAAIASNRFTISWHVKQSQIAFDSRAFNIPKEEVCNYFIWRQQDWIRNSVQMLAQVHFSHKELHGKNQSEMHDMLHRKGINWVDLKPMLKNGAFLFKSKKPLEKDEEDRLERSFIDNPLKRNIKRFNWVVDYNQIFTQNRGIIEQYLQLEEADNE